MALSTFVVIRQISNLSDARYCAGMGADVLGFVIEPTQPGALTKMAFSEITGWVAGVTFMAEFTSANPAEINLAATEFGLDYVLLTKQLPTEALKQIEIPVIQHVSYSAENLLKNLTEQKEGVAYFLIDLEGKTSLTQTEKQELKTAAAQFPILLSNGITAQNVQQLVQEIAPAGICLQGGEEIKPGLRDFNELADILEQLEQEEA